MDLGFKGKVALVTGAGSQIGFGHEIALLLAKEGCDAVAVTDINAEDLKKTAEAVKALGVKSVAVPADITKKAEVDAMVNMLAKTIPLGRGATQADIANAAAFFASDLSGYITGAVLHVSGGSVLD